MPERLLELNSLIGPAVVAAAVSGVVSVVGLIVSTKTARAIHAEKIDFDRDLAERKFAFDKELAERKFKYDRELHDHKRRVELAETVLAEFQQMGDVISAIRSPMAYGNESAERPRRENETEEHSRLKDTYFVPLMRIKKNSEFISGFTSKRYRSRAILGEGIDEAFRTIEEVLIKIQVSATTLISMVERGKIALERNEALCERCERDIWYGSPGEDVLQPMVKGARTLVEEICRPILERGRLV
jgi:hypothetical protein